MLWPPREADTRPQLANQQGVIPIKHLRYICNHLRTRKLYRHKGDRSLGCPDCGLDDQAKLLWAMGMRRKAAEGRARVSVKAKKK